jgi:hypothetical protein
VTRPSGESSELYAISSGTPRVVAFIIVEKARSRGEEVKDTQGVGVTREKELT